jgi:hypothetical protein
VLGLYQIKLAAQPCSPPVSWQPLPWPLAGLQGSALRNGIPTYFITPVVTCSIAAGGDCGRVTGKPDVVNWSFRLVPTLTDGTCVLGNPEMSHAMKGLTSRKAAPDPRRDPGSVQVRPINLAFRQASPLWGTIQRVLASRRVLSGASRRAC